jgi:hypothetical protein
LLTQITLCIEYVKTKVCTNNPLSVLFWTLALCMTGSWITEALYAQMHIRIPFVKYILQISQAILILVCACFSYIASRQRGNQSNEKQNEGQLKE